MAHKATSRLSDFEIEEVSGVDRAANGEKFVLVKSADGVPVDEDKTKAKAPEAAEAAAEEKADDEPAAEEAPAAEPAAEEPAAEEPAKPATGAPVHASLLAEMAQALQKAVQNLIDAAVEGEDVDKAMAGMDSMWSMLSQIRLSASVVRLSKAAGDPFAKVERMILSKQADLIRKARRLLKEEAAAEPTAEPTAEPAAEENPIEQIVGMLGSIEGKLDQLIQAQAKDAVGKALGQLETRITKMETTPVAPSTGGSAGVGRVDARKEVVWPQDLNQG